MEIIKILKFFSFLIYLNLNSLVNSRELIFVYEHVRHGARGPSSSYDSIFYDGRDEYNVNWTYDGELSAIGKRQHYFLGVRNRIKYQGLINFDHYNPMEILIHATDYNRTHQSINSELLGMFGNTREKELTKEELERFQMINLNNMGKKNNDLLQSVENELKEIGNQVNKNSIPIFNIRSFPSKRIFLVDHCTKLNQYRDEHVGPKVRALMDEFEHKYAYAFKEFINNTSYFKDYNKMKSITDHFICDYDNKKDLSILENKGVILKDFLNFSKTFYGTFIFDWFIDNYTSGLEETHLMQDLLGYMDRRIEHLNETTYKAPKMVMDCGHDTTVGPIARYMSSAFNIEYHRFCEFACNVYYELYKDGNEFFVDYYLDDEKLISNMNYKEFKEKMKSKFWNDTYADEFCGKKEDTILKKNKVETSGIVYLGASIIFISLFIIFASSAFIFFLRMKKLEIKIKEKILVDNIINGDGGDMPILD